MTSYYNLSLIQEILLIHGGKDGGNSRTDTIFAYDGTSVVYVFVSQHAILQQTDEHACSYITGLQQNLHHCL